MADLQPPQMKQTVLLLAEDEFVFPPEGVWSNLLLKLQFVCPYVSLYILIKGVFFFFAMHHFTFSACSISIYQYYSFFSRWNCVFACELKSKIRRDMHPNADCVRRQQIHLAANWEKQLQLRAPALGCDSEIGWIIYIFRGPLPFADRFQSGKKYSTLTSEQMRICVALPCPTGLHAGNLSLIGESREQVSFLFTSTTTNLLTIERRGCRA